MTHISRIVPIVVVSALFAPSASAELAAPEEGPSESERSATVASQSPLSPRESQPKFVAIGFVASHLKHRGEREAGRGFVVRLGHNRLALEAEWLRLPSAEARVGGGLVFMARRRWSPLVVAGGGAIVDRLARRRVGRYLEVGGGWLLRKGRCGLGFEVRAGVRRNLTMAVRDSSHQATVAGLRAPPPERPEGKYLRGRFSALIHF